MMHLHHKVSALVDGELQGAARRRAVAHLRKCAACRHEVEATLAVKRRLLGSEAGDPSSDLFATLDRAVPPGYPPVPTETAAESHGTRWLLVGAGTVSVAVLAVAYAVGGPAPTPTATVLPPVDEANADFLSAVAARPLADPAIETLGSTAPARPLAVSAPHLDAEGAEPTPTVPAGDDPQAVRALTRAAQAPERYAYRGVRVIEAAAGDGTPSARVSVAHVPRQGTVLHLLDDGDAVFVDREFGLGPSTGARAVRLLREAYDLAVIGPGSVLGRDATIVGVGRDGTLAARVWIDDRTGMILRRELFEDGQMVRSSAFARLHVSRRGFLPHLPPGIDSPPASTIKASMAESMNDAGWTCPGSVGGDFDLTGLGHVEAVGDALVAHYSDGLSTMTVFEQRGQLASGSVDGFQDETWGQSSVYVDYGLPTVAVWQSGDTVYTVVTDAPPARAREVVAAFPPGGPDDGGGGGLWDRIGTGFSRIAGAVTP